MKIVINNHRAVSWNKIYSAGHWHTRQKLAKKIHKLVKFTAFQQAKGKPEFKNRVDISIVGYYKDKRRHDSDNIAHKCYIDGLKRMVVEDDDTRYIRKVTTEARIGQKEDKLIIRIKEI